MDRRGPRAHGSAVGGGNGTSGGFRKAKFIRAHSGEQLRALRRATARLVCLDGQQLAQSLVGLIGLLSELRPLGRLVCTVP